MHEDVSGEVSGIVGGIIGGRLLYLLSCVAFSHRDMGSINEDLGRLEHCCEKKWNTSNYF